MVKIVYTVETIYLIRNSLYNFNTLLIINEGRENLLGLLDNKNMITELLNINLVKELGLDSLPQEKKELLINQMMEVVESRINLEVLSILTEDEKEELDTVLDSNADMVAFLRSKIPNFDLLVAETIANFKKEVVEMHQPMVSTT